MDERRTARAALSRGGGSRSAILAMRFRTLVKCPRVMHTRVDGPWRTLLILCIL